MEKNKPPLNCPGCGSVKTVKDGSCRGTCRRLCKECGRRYSGRTREAPAEARRMAVHLNKLSKEDQEQCKKMDEVSKKATTIFIHFFDKRSVEDIKKSKDFDFAFFGAEASSSARVEIKKIDMKF